MKKIMSILACVAVVLSACQKEETPSLSFETATYVMGADDAVTVKAVVSAAPAADLAVAFTTSGSAVLGTDYELSAESIIIKAGETAGEVVVSPKNNLGADLNITLTLTLPSGYQAGNFVSTNIALGSKEKVAYSFAKQESKLINEVDVTLNLIGLASGANFTAGGNYELPFVIDAASTAVAGTDFEVKGGATAFVFEKGAKNATITLVAKKEITEGSKEVIIKLDETAIAAAYGDRFSAGVIAATKAILTKGLIFSDLEGKWAYASTPILDDPEADCWTLAGMLEEVGDGGNGCVEHQRCTNSLEHPLAAGELDLSHSVSSHGGAEQVSGSTDNRYENGVEYVSGEGHPGGVHQSEQILKVIERGVHNDESRREHPKLIKGLQGLYYNVIHGQEHKYAEDYEHECDSKVAACRTVEYDFMLSCS